MLLPLLLITFLTTISASQPSSLQLLFPNHNRQYQYGIKTNISCGTLEPVESGTYWTLEGRLLVQVFDNFTRARFTLSHLMTSAYTKQVGFAATWNKNDEAAQSLLEAWEVEYQDNGNVDHLYVNPDEPLWATNMKRALSFNFQIRKGVGTYYNMESCLYQNQKDCQVLYAANGNTIRKYNSLHILSENSGYSSWMSVPMDYSKAAFFGGPEAMYSGPADYYGPLDNIGTADRTYELDDKVGLMSLELKSVFQHKTRSHILGVITTLSLYYDQDVPSEKVDKLNLTKTSKRYVSRGYSDPSNGIENYTQEELRSRTYKILLKIANKGIDADNIVRNASRIHSLDFVNLLKTMSQLEYPALHKLFGDMVLGTSYDIETSRNIFLEVLPHVRTNACALFIKYLVVEQKTKIEDSTLLSLVRKLPFNVANHSQDLLEQLEVFTRLGLDFPQEIRHAGILSFATLVFKAAEVRRVKEDYLDNIVVKYFRMYSDCPQYLDRLIWLQGLSNIQYSTEAYMWTIFNNATFNRHERYWAIIATTPVYAPSGYAATWHILMNEEEHIQIRIAALNTFLSSRIRPSELLSIHNYIMNCPNQQLKRFWYTTIKSLEESKTYNGYRVASNYIHFLTNQVTNPNPEYWATGNHIVGTYDDQTSTGAMIQLLSVGDPKSGLPAVVHLRIKTVSELMSTSDITVFIKAEGVSTSLFQKIHTISSQELNIDYLIELLKKMKVQIVEPEKVHIEVVVKAHDKTVYAVHFNQSRFKTWNGEDLTKSIKDFMRFGSHINQQVVIYPFQLDANIPTELGTPVRLQTAIVSFSSIRGNLTAPTSNDLKWRNDLHLRYQGTAVTALSTDGPFFQSKHTARVQQSIVAHVPIKFEVSFSPVDRSISFTWPPTTQYAGLALHARTQVEMESLKERHTYTVNTRSNRDSGEQTGLFFDCDKPITVAELLEKLMASKAVSYDFLTNLKPSLLMLNGLLLLSAPPSGSCGLVIGGEKPSPNDRFLSLEVTCEELKLLQDEKMVVRLVNKLHYGEIQSDGEVLLKEVNGSVQLEIAGGNVTFDLELKGREPHLKNESKRNWLLCFKQQDRSHGSVDRDISSKPAAYDGRASLSYGNGDAGSTCPAKGSKLDVEYRGVPSGNDDLERYFEITLRGNNLPKMALTDPSLRTHPTIGQSLKNLEVKSLNVTAFVKEKNGVASVVINNEPEIRVKSDNFGWLLDNWSNMQIMKKFGIYRECRLYDNSVQTLYGTLDRLASEECETLALAECTDTPRFAVLRSKNRGVKMYTGGNYAQVTRMNGDFKISINGQSVDCRNGCSYPDGQLQPDFKISIIENVVKMSSRVSGVQVYVKRESVVVLAPHSYMNTGCGSCVSQHYYRLC